nr:FecR family protein [Parabacteroides goldsteinii]
MKSETIYQIILSVLADEATDTERRILTQWLEKSGENRKEYTKFKQLFQITSLPPKEMEVDTERAWQIVGSQTVYKKKTVKFPIWISYAAMIVVIVFIGISLYNTEPAQDNQGRMEKVDIKEFEEPTLLLENGEKIALNGEPFSIKQEQVTIKNDKDNKLVYESQKEANKTTVLNNHLVIPKGRTYQLHLEDGSRIWLNSESELIYPEQFIGDKREVTLIGEAFFEVAKNAEKPFLVKTKGIEIKVLGTSFNVSCYGKDNTINTTLVEGSVSIHTEQGKEQTITPSEQFTYNKDNHSTKIQTVNTELYTSWIDGKYIFKDTTLEEIIDKLQRWHDIHPNYEEQDLRHRRFSITIDRQSTLDQILEVISFTSDVKLEKAGNSINIKKQRREE